MRKIWIAVSVVVLLAASSTSWADGTGLTVTGALTLYTPDQVPLRPQIGGINYLDSANGGVPAGYGNSTTNGTAVIGPGVEFGVTNGTDLVTVDYTGTTVTITDRCLAGGCGSTPFTVAMYNPAITGYSVVAYDFPNVALGYGDTFYFPNNGYAGSLTFFGAPGFTGGSITLSYTSTTPSASMILQPFLLVPKSFTVAADNMKVLIPGPVGGRQQTIALSGPAAVDRRRFLGV